MREGWAVAEVAGCGGVERREKNSPTSGGEGVWYIQVKGLIGNM